MAIWYLGSTKHAAITQWAANTAYSIGDIRRQLAAPTNGNERAFRVTTAGTSHLTTEPTWVLTKAATTNDNTVVWTEVTGNATYGWNAAAARINIMLNGASSWPAAGDTVYMHKDHTETWNTNITPASIGSSAAPLQILSVDEALTALTPGGTFIRVVGGATAMSFSGVCYVNGWTCDNQDGGLNWNTSTSRWFFENCTLGNKGGMQIGINGSGLLNRTVEFRNVIIKMNSTASGIQLEGGSILWEGGSTTGSVPTNLFKNVTVGAGGSGKVRGVNLSACSGNLIAGGEASRIHYDFENCKLHASATMAGNPSIGYGGSSLRVVNCDSGDTNYNYFYQDFGGTIVDEQTIVHNGPTRKFVTPSTVKFFRPLITDPVVRFNSIVGSPVTVRFEIVSDGLTLEDDEIWVIGEYLGTSGFPLSLFENTRLADPIFGTPSAWGTSGVTWVTTGLTSPVKQFLEVTFTPQEEGVMKFRIAVARPSTTVYVDMKPIVS